MAAPSAAAAEMQYCVTSSGQVLSAAVGSANSPFRIPGGPVPRSKQGKISFRATFNDILNNTNAGFDHPQFGAERRAVVDRVMTYISSVIDESGTLDIVFEQSITRGNTEFLATAGPVFSEEVGFTNGFAFERVTTGTDRNGPGEAELFAQVNFTQDWFTGTGAPGSAADVGVATAAAVKATKGS